MTLHIIGSNQTEVRLNDRLTIFFSYTTAVAAYVAGQGYLRTAQHYSPTTTQHITRWLNGASATPVPQSHLDALGA